MHNPSTGGYSSRRKILFTYLVTYLIIITVLFMVIGIFSYSNIIRIEQEKAKMEMEQVVTKAVDILDTNLRDILNLQSSFYVNPDVSRLRKMKADFKPKEYMRFLDMSNKLSMYTSTSQFLDQVTLFFHFNQLFIASNMLDSRPEVFYELNFSNKDITYTQWRNEQMQYRCLSSKLSHLIIKNISLLRYPILPLTWSLYLYGFST